MQSSNLEPREESTKSLHDYLSNNNYRSLLVFSLIFMFSIVFYLIYLIVDTLTDKTRHYNLSLQCYERYESAKQRQNEKSKQLNLVEQDDKEKLMEKNRKIEYTIWSYRNLQISFIHSVLCSLWLIRILYARNTELFSDLLFHITWDTYLLLAFSCGYFLYDFYDIYANGYFKQEWVVCVHHWIVLVSFSYHMINLVSVGYTTIALLMEFNSVFLHARKLLKFYGFKSNSSLVNLNCFLNILSFVLFRFGVLAIVFYSVKIDGHRVTIKYLAFLLTCLILMAIINIVLFKRIIVKDIFPMFFKKKTSSKNDNNMEHEQCEHLLKNADLIANTKDLEQCQNEISNLVIKKRD